jgi:hypothetical protein
MCLPKRFGRNDCYRKNFAAYWVTHNTKEAFLKFMDTSAVMFEKGEPVNDYQRWLKRESAQAC